MQSKTNSTSREGDHRPGLPTPSPVSIEEAAITATVGPFSGSVAEELHGSDEALGLRRVLETSVDEVVVSERDGVQWVELRKSLEAGG